MKIQSSKKKRITLGLVGLAASLSMAAVTNNAFAAFSATASPIIVEYFQNQVLIQLPGPINYIGTTSTVAGCTSGITVETLKLWTSLAQGALLSGKNVRIGFNTCGGTNYITAVDLFQ
jgi:hypothetical protein